MQQQMFAQDEETLELRETFTSLQQEVEAKTKKLKKVKRAGKFKCSRHTTSEHTQSNICIMDRHTCFFPYSS